MSPFLTAVRLPARAGENLRTASALRQSTCDRDNQSDLPRAPALRRSPPSRGRSAKTFFKPQHGREFRPKRALARRQASVLHGDTSEIHALAASSPAVRSARKKWLVHDSPPTRRPPRRTPMPRERADHARTKIRPVNVLRVRNDKEPPSPRYELGTALRLRHGGQSVAPAASARMDLLEVGLPRGLHAGNVASTSADSRLNSPRPRSRSPGAEA
jgi:hypothetical protein